jgi:hypothetical protein
VGSDLHYGKMRAERLATVVADTFTPLRGVTDESMAVWSADTSRWSPALRRVSSTGTIASDEDRRLCLELFSADGAA